MLSVSEAPDKCVYLRWSETPAGSISAGEPKNYAQSKVIEIYWATWLHDSCQLTGYCIFDQAHTHQSMSSFRLLLNMVAVIEQHRLTQTNEAEIKMTN